MKACWWKCIVPWMCSDEWLKMTKSGHGSRGTHPPSHAPLQVAAGDEQQDPLMLWGGPRPVCLIHPVSTLKPHKKSEGSIPSICPSTRRATAGTERQSHLPGRHSARSQSQAACSWALSFCAGLNNNRDHLFILWFTTLRAAANISWVLTLGTCCA